MMQYFNVFMVETNPIVKEDVQTVQEETVSIVENLTHGEIVQPMERNAKNVAKTTTLRPYAKAMVILTLINATQAGPDPRKRVRAKSSMKQFKTMEWKILRIKSNLSSIMMYTSIVSTQE